MQKTSQKTYLIEPKTAVILTLIIFLTTLINFTYPEFNNITETTFNRINFYAKKFNFETNQFLIIEAYDSDTKQNNHAIYINKLLFNLTRLKPNIIIIDSPYPKMQKILEPWIKKLKKNIIFTYDYFTNDFQDEFCNYPINRAFFVVNQKKNLEIINLMTKNEFLSIGQNVANLKGLKNISSNDYKIKYFFNDSMIQKVSINEILNNKLPIGSLKNKIIFLRTHPLSFFKTPYLTPIGIMNTDTLMANDIQTINNYEIPYEINFYIQKTLLFIFIIIISFIFIKTWLVKAIFYSILIFDFQFIIGFIIYSYYNIQYDYFIFGFYSFIHILILILFSLFNMNRMKDSLFELDRIKKYLVTQNQAMAHLKKLSELGRISSGIYHEINNPLHNIFNSLKMLKEDNTLSYESKETLSIALFEIERLQKLSKNLKGFYKPDNTKMESVNIHEIIDFGVKLVKHSLKNKNITIIKKYYISPLIILSNADKLQQVILNLLINSIDAIKENGTIFITTSLKNNKIQINIKDTGNGIPSENRKEIFQAFFTTKGDLGSGLGLFVSYEIINQLGGDIVLSEYKKGEGAEFTIILNQNSV